jgi:SAM-dependent methyltransferase
VVAAGDHLRGASHTVGAPPDASAWIRTIHLVSFAKDRAPALPAVSVERQDGRLLLQIVEHESEGTGDTIRLALPDGAASGRIEILATDEARALPSRLLPAGILPPDLGAARRRLQWDLPYQIKGQAIWDTGRPSSELKRMVESGRIKPCRAVEIGCGTGSDAIYLASQGFDVTAIDIAPTALNLAARKANQADVNVDWLLADILHPPELEPFEFVYDRGCYHEVRQHHARQYVAALARLSRQGSKILILAGNANRDTYWRFAGPPRVREADIRSDFGPPFAILQLREFRFDAAPPQKQGALAWSILLTRAHAADAAEPTAHRSN